ncbi:MAG: CDP-alcohol phosphatidyltransferase family protein [Propionibacteriaceae bacterium]|jgi:CDP-diacylglycerol--glycerol-3-phosphate 3-phosphatidyltransferase|nr:CDP-alcohol phosphatidyltransferase family protein [Propionibacteriaceae bacterium]
MLEHARKVLTALTAAPARWFVRHHVPANAVTLAGTLLTIAAALATLPFGWLWQGAILITLFALADGIDGQMARMTAPTRFGALFDSSLDRLADGAMVSAALIHLVRTDAHLAWICLALVALVTGQVIPYVRARAGDLGLDGTGGITGRADRIGLLAIGCFLAGLGLTLALPIALTIMAILGLITVTQRLHHAWLSPGHGDLP